MGGGNRGSGKGGNRKWADDAWFRDLADCHRCRASAGHQCRSPSGIPRQPHAGRDSLRQAEIDRRSARSQSGAVRRGEPPSDAGKGIDPWFHGYACALAQIWRLHRDGQTVRHLLAASGIRFKALEEAGCDDLDIEAIRSALNDSASIHDKKIERVRRTADQGKG